MLGTLIFFICRQQIELMGVLRLTYNQLFLLVGVKSVPSLLAPARRSKRSQSTNDIQMLRIIFGCIIRIIRIA